MTLKLKRFREGLENLMTDEFMRPFACRGDPCKCRIFVVGTNPATKMNKPFLATYWDDSKGFLYDKFYRDYDAQKPRRGNTARSCIEKFVCGASPIPCLETNIYATPSKSETTLPEDKKDPTIFEFLLKEIQPDAIFLYRKSAICYFQTQFDITLYGDEFVTADVFGDETHVLHPRRNKKGGLQRITAISHSEIYATGKKFKETL